MTKNKNTAVSRIIGRYSSDKEGPLLVITASVHGNEPSGVIALEKIFDELESSKPEIEGTILGILGNQKAFDKEQRYIDEDLNRTWTKENIQKAAKDTSEKKEMHEIIDLLKDFPEEDYTTRYFLDCHTTSSASLPYISVQKVDRNDDWAHHFPTYIVRGFSDIVSGTIDHYFTREGFTGFVFEAGKNYTETSIENQEGIIWLVIKEACKLDWESISCYPECFEAFKKNKAPGQKTFEIVYRHGLEKGDDFTMEPGFENFQKIEKGQLLAEHNGEKIHSDWDAYIFMPLYQSQGDDGFFIIKEVE